MRYEIEVPAKGARAARKAMVSLSFGEAEIARPANGADKSLAPSVSLAIVDVREIDPPAGEPPQRVTPRFRPAQKLSNVPAGKLGRRRGGGFEETRTGEQET